MTKTTISGFTLTELMITIALLSIVLAIAIPNLTLFLNQTRLKGIAENLAQDLVFARSEAIRTNKMVRLHVESTCYGLSNKTTICDCTKTSPSDANFCEIKRVGSPSNVSFTKTSTSFDEIAFDPVRGLPLNKDGVSSLTTTQILDIEQSNVGKIKTSLSVIGSVCLSSSGTSKIAGYPNAC
ncbi:GspH/FimT family pseudopilin [Chitinibacter bivalviorum]|uniref:Type II secretion system protein H n=1 Tax=Chitinibacter bivalviorum TaxID=2739434 RepID=A0A7H9BFD4_9NEIS|nr:GspH/FimT family pseudopilin [Chitinibacter bivalviorum]QLG87329.1 GspH/FimT family pseudopilin [Chitinibacter bivalviorum]